MLINKCFLHTLCTAMVAIPLWPYYRKGKTFHHNFPLSPGPGSYTSSLSGDLYTPILHFPGLLRGLSFSLFHTRVCHSPLMPKALSMPPLPPLLTPTTLISVLSFTKINRLLPLDALNITLNFVMDHRGIIKKLSWCTNKRQKEMLWSCS